VGARVPDLRVHATNGVDLPLRDAGDARDTVLMFVSPWCESYLEKSRPQRAQACRSAREQSERLAREGRWRWVGIASGLWSSEAELAAYAKDSNVSIPLSLDETGDLFRRFGVTEVPTLIVVGADGRVRSRIDTVTADLQSQLSSHR